MIDIPYFERDKARLNATSILQNGDISIPTMIDWSKFPNGLISQISYPLYKSENCYISGQYIYPLISQDDFSEGYLFYLVRFSFANNYQENIGSYNYFVFRPYDRGFTLNGVHYTSYCITASVKSIYDSYIEYSEDFLYIRFNRSLAGETALNGMNAVYLYYSDSKDIFI